MPARLRALVTASFTALAVLAAALSAVLLPATAAHAESRTVQGGRLDWGIKSSFQSYVTGPIAKGSYFLTGGAATVGGSTFRFHSATGSYDGAMGAFRASFSGGVRFVGHQAASGGYQLDLTLSRPTVSINGTVGTLYVDVVSKAKDTGSVTTATQVPFATLSLGGIDMRGGGDAVVLNNLPATLTTQGARSFAGYYTAGTPLDPVSLAADVRPAVKAAAPSPTPTPSKSTQKKAASHRALVNGAVDWGVRRTFREYVTGDIARGKWTLTDGAQDGGALFRFPSGRGTYDKGALDATFKGAVRFTGAHGLDLELSAVRVTVAKGTGTLYADVTSDRLTGRKVPLVTFAAKDLTARDGLAKVTEAPAELTARGAKAFGGMYPAGTAMDPVSLAVALTEGTELPALPDLGSAVTDTAAPAPTTAAPDPAPSVEPVVATGDDGTPVLPVALGAGGALVLALGGAALLRRRNRTAAAASATGSGTDEERSGGS
ncbi:HtaA domain-containing protein [Streptomyces sp. NPDC094154]|uniref:HtaA domain-containing protein n=1 Tax=Streptomyces sp. NPDC094154 TaxID=3366059 RepID=UPI0037F22291